MSKCPCCGSDLAKADKPLVSLDTNRLLTGGEIIQLMPREAEMMAILADAMPLIVDHERFISRLWGDISTENAMHTLKVHICRLRRKIIPYGLGIETHHSRGYSLKYIRKIAA